MCWCQKKCSHCPTDRQGSLDPLNRGKSNLIYLRTKEQSATGGKPATEAPYAGESGLTHGMGPGNVAHLRKAQGSSHVWRPGKHARLAFQTRRSWPHAGVKPHPVFLPLLWPVSLVHFHLQNAEGFCPIRAFSHIFFDCSG